MRRPYDVLCGMVARKGSSKMLTFGAPHIFKAMRIMLEQKYTGRQSLGSYLRLGAGATKTLVARLRQHGLADSVRAGTFLTPGGVLFAQELFRDIPSQCSLEQCSVAGGMYNHAIMLRDPAGMIRNGIDQRDYAVMYGARGATTLAFEDNKFVFPGEAADCMSEDQDARDALLARLGPGDGDLVIITSADDPFVAEISAINSALCTLLSD